MQTFVVNRSGMPPLVFNGEIVKQADARLADDGQPRPRWHSIVIYAVDGGKYYVVQIDYHSTFRNEIGFSEAHVCPSPDRVAYVLGRHDPTSHVQGWPALERFAGQQRHLRHSVCHLYANAVSQVLNDKLFAVPPQACVELCCDPDHARLVDVCLRIVKTWNADDDNEVDNEKLFDEMEEITNSLKLSW